jgi:hypothetical protein
MTGGPEGVRALAATEQEVLAADADGVHHLGVDLTGDTLLVPGDFRAIKLDGGYAYFWGMGNISRVKLPNGQLETVAKEVSFNFQVADGVLYTSEYRGGMESGTGPCSIAQVALPGGARSTVYEREDCEQSFSFLVAKGMLYVSRFSTVDRIPLETDPVIPPATLSDGARVSQFTKVGATVLALGIRAAVVPMESRLWSVSGTPAAPLSETIFDLVDQVVPAGDRIAFSTRSTDFNSFSIHLLGGDPLQSVAILAAGSAPPNTMAWSANSSFLYYAVASQPIVRVPVP